LSPEGGRFLRRSKLHRQTANATKSKHVIQKKMYRASYIFQGVVSAVHRLPSS
jgi:hypothetical protein